MQDRSAALIVDTSLKAPKPQSLKAPNFFPASAPPKQRLAQMFQAITREREQPRLDQHNPWRHTVDTYC